jgi:hypothetical protein
VISPDGLKGQLVGTPPARTALVCADSELVGSVDHGGVGGMRKWLAHPGRRACP